MAVPLLDSPASTTPRQPRSRWGWLIIPAVAIMLAVGAFFHWGPIGLGNGPLFVRDAGAEGTAVQHPGPVGTVVPIFTAGPGPAVVDGIDVVGGTRYPSPRVLATGMLSKIPNCSAAVVATQPAVTGTGFTLAGCGSYRGPLIGHAFLPTHRPAAITAALQLSAPAGGTCWAITKVVVHYHVGGRHFSGAYKFALAACRGVSSAGVQAAMQAAFGVA